GDGGAIINQGPLTITNSILNGNGAELQGGGIFAFSYSSLVSLGKNEVTISNSTITGNSAAQAGGGIKLAVQTPAAGVLLFDTIVDGNTSGLGGADVDFNDTLRANFDPASAYNLVGSVTDTTNLTGNFNQFNVVFSELNLDAAFTPGPGLAFDAG